MRNLKFFLALFAFIWAGLGAPGVAQAALQISICGHSTYDCEKGSDPNYGWGDQTPIGSEVQSSQICNVDKTKCLTVPNNPNNLGPTPAGWTSPTQPPSTASKVTAIKLRASHPFTEDREAAFQLWLSDLGYIKGDAPPNTTTGGAYGYGQAYACAATAPDCWATNNGKRVGDFDGTQICPAGYTDSSGVCTLSNASLVKKPTDGKCTILRSGNTFSGDANDPDCSVSTSNSPAQQLNLGGSGTPAVNASKDGYSGSVSNNTTDGSTTITFSVPNYSNGTTTTFTLKLGAPDGTGKQVVTGISKSTGSGIGTGADPNAQPQPEAQCGVPGKPPCEMKIDETGTPTDSNLSAEKTAFDQKTAERTTALQGVATVSNLGLGLSITWPTAGCSDLTFAMPASKGNLVVPWCSKQADIKNAGGWLVGILTAFGLFSIGVGALRKG